MFIPTWQIQKQLNYFIFTDSIYVHVCVCYPSFWEGTRYIEESSDFKKSVSLKLLRKLAETESEKCRPAGRKYT